MRRVHWLQAIAVVWFLTGAAAGTLLVTFRGLVPLEGQGDCTRAVGSSGGCFMMANPNWWVGVIVWMLAIIGGVVLWSVAVGFRSNDAGKETRA